jgi:hypothetical protein
VANACWFPKSTDPEACVFCEAPGQAPACVSGPCAEEFWALGLAESPQGAPRNQSQGLFDTPGAQHREGAAGARGQKDSTVVELPAHDALEAEAA